jgi:tRNA(Leu) C34 or U34 (ribose-2'-O)-methylase TrmL
MVDAEIRALNLSTTAALALYEHARQRAQAVESAPRL